VATNDPAVTPLLPDPNSHQELFLYLLLVELRAIRALLEVLVPPVAVVAAPKRARKPKAGA
jgi:hypothetical protein